MADSIVTIALGVISKNLGMSMMAKIFEITAFWPPWPPWLLLHLGGLDTITTYCLKDNKLWLRHLLRLGIQTGVVLNIWIITLTGSLTLHSIDSDVF